MSDYDIKWMTLLTKIFVQLGENFITPFDREDINYLAAGLDDIQIIYLLQLNTSIYTRPEVKQYSELFFIDLQILCRNSKRN